jgi:esterase/lipase superfamily enzyme
MIEGIPNNASHPHVAFLTDRNDENTSDISTRFGSQRPPNWGPTCGLVDFSQVASRATSSSYSGKISLSPKDLPRGQEQCSQFIASTVGETPNKRVLLFVHGYNTTFESAVRGAIALAENVEYPGLVIVWSWPSEGWREDYWYDEETADWAQAHLELFLHSLNSAAPDLEVDVLAHSMGNRAILYLLEMEKQNKNLFQSIVFAAPDVAQDKFQQALDRIGSLGRLQTLYSCDTDYALAVSARLHSPHGRRIPRAGNGGQNILTSSQFESVDVIRESASDSPITYTGFGHSYIFDEPKAVSDLKKVIVEGKHADDRGLTVRHSGNNKYWSIDP